MKTGGADRSVQLDLSFAPPALTASFFVHLFTVMYHLVDFCLLLAFSLFSHPDPISLSSQK